MSVFAFNVSCNGSWAFLSRGVSLRLPLQVRYGKTTEGPQPKRCSVLTVFHWSVEIVSVEPDYDVELKPNSVETDHVIATQKAAQIITRTSLPAVDDATDQHPRHPPSLLPSRSYQALDGDCGNN